VDRRTFLKGALAGAGTVATSARVAGANLALPSLGVERRPARTPVEHLVVVMMENRSVDHYLGWYAAENPDFDAVQHATYPDLRAAEAPLVATEAWGQAGRGNFHGRGFADPSHGWSGGRIERNDGACDGWLDPRTGNDEFALAYYDAADIPVWAQLTRGYQVYDRWHCSLLGPTQPNRYYLHSAQSGGLKNNDLPPELYETHPEWIHGWDWPTIWTLADTFGLDATYYFSNLPQVAFWGERHLNRARHISDYYLQAAAGTLPQFAIIDPWYIGPNGIANDDHPHADIRLGQAFLSDVVEAFVTSPCYQRGAMVLTYDEWGGFFDHVDPPQLSDDRATPADPGGEDDFGQVGFRVPSTVISPWTRTRPGRTSRVDHRTYEHSSILRFAADNWALPHLTTRQAQTNSLEAAFRRFREFDPNPAFVPYEAPLHLTVEPILEDPVGTVDPITGFLPVDLPEVPTAAPVSTESSDLHRLAELGWFEGLPVRTDWRFEDSFLHTRPELLAEVTSPGG
jgi:phospholipase C